MRVHQELTVTGDPEQLRQFLVAVEARLADGWERDADAEKRVAGVGASKGYCYRRPRGEGGALLWLSLDRTERRLWVSNIVPTGDRIQRDEYNAILQEFRDKFVEDAAKQSGVVATLSAEDVELSSFMTSAAFDALRDFSRSANRSVLHPLDTQRWWDFVIRTHTDGTDVPVGLLERWFSEVEGWPEDRADDLVGDFEQLRDFLAYYDDRA